MRLLTIIALAGALAAQTPEGDHLIPSLDGKTLFLTYCAVCHGKTADGQGPMAPVLKVRVADLTGIAKRHGGKFPFEMIQRRIDGTDSAVAGHGTREMPIWGPIFSQVASDQDFGKVRIYNLTKYLQSIQK
jgi:mono/diheme cytochrome c family protein